MVIYMKHQFEFNNYGHKAVGSGQWAVIGVTEHE